jgi:hypothetical protein
MKMAARIALGAVEYIFTVILTSCFMMVILRWALSPYHGFEMMLRVSIGGLILTVAFLSHYYSCRLITSRSRPIRIIGSVALAAVTTAITIPVSSLISDFLEIPVKNYKLVQVSRQPIGLCAR